jgi:RecA-family ATPase
VALKNQIPIARIMTEPIAPILWEVEGWITQGDRVMMYGEFGAGKSYLAHAMALSLAAGKPWMGRYRCPKRRVLFLDEEMSEQETRRRIKRLGLGIGLDGSEELTIASHSLDGAGLDQGRLMTLKQHLKEFPADVIFVDSFRRIMLGDENRAQDVSAFWRSIEPIWDRGNRTIIVLHHMNKPPSEGMREERHRASGSTDILAGVDSAMAVGKIEVPQHAPRMATVTGVKSRSESEHERVIATWPEVVTESPQRITVIDVGKGGPNPQVWGTASIVCGPDAPESR